MKRLLFFIFTAMLLSACSTTNLLTISVLEPAPVPLPGYIKKVGLINRTHTSQRNTIINAIEKTLSIEGKNLDEDGANECLVGLQEELQQNPRFYTVEILEHLQMESPGLGMIPSPLTPNEVKNICNANEVDGLFILEAFDSDSHLETGTAAVPTTTLMGTFTTSQHVATLFTDITTSWRIYDPIAENLIDDFSISDYTSSTGTGFTPIAASKAIAGRNDAVLLLSNNIGHNYGTRILPYPVRVMRNYYVRGSENFKIAKRKARTDNWEGAAKLWLEETKNPKKKIAGRASYNMAIISEIRGDIPTAIEWAQKAYEKYNIKRALQYIELLKEREMINKIIEEQTLEAEK